MLHDITDPTEVTVTPVFAAKVVEPGGHTYIMVDGNYYERFDRALEHDEHVSDHIVQAVETYSKEAFDAVAGKIAATATAFNLGTRADEQPVNFLTGKVDPLDAMKPIAKARIAALITRDAMLKRRCGDEPLQPLTPNLEELGAQVKGQHATFT